MFSTSFCPYLTYRLRPPSHKLYPYTTLFRSIETKKEVIQPAARTINSSGVKLKPKPSSLTKLAPSITGMDMKNENSAAIGRSVPNKIPPTMVEPEREVPGIKDKIWKRPT